MKVKDIYLKIIIICVCCLFMFLAVGFAVLTKNNSEAVDTKPPKSVTYAESGKPKNRGFLVKFENGGSEYFYLDFINDRISVIMLSGDATDKAVAKYGYTVYRTIYADYDFLASFIDSYDSVIINNEYGEAYRYTGVQATQLLRSSTDIDVKKKLIVSLFGNIKEKGFRGENLVDIINGTNTDLNYPDGYPFVEYLAEISGQVYFIN